MNCCDAYGGCDRGADCPARATRLHIPIGGEQVNTGSDAGLPTVMFTEPYAWMAESVQRAKEPAIAAALVALVAFGVLVGFAR